VKHRFYIAEGNKHLASMDDKAAALRYAAKQAHVRQSVTKVFRYDGVFIKSFDGRSA